MTPPWKSVFHHLENVFPSKMTSWLERGESQMVPGQENKRVRKNFTATRTRFCQGDMQVVDWSIVLQESDSSGPHAAPFEFDGFSQFTQ